MKTSMKLYINFLFLCVSLSSKIAIAHEYSSIGYKISPLQNAAVPVVRIDTEIKGAFDAGNLIIDLPSHWAGANYSEQIKNIKVNSSDRGFNVTKKERNADTEYGHELKIIIPQKTDNIKISYEIHQHPQNPSHVHKAMIRQDLIHSPGYGMFAVPSGIEDKEIKINIDWNIPDKWKIITSHGNSRSLNFSTTISELLHNLSLT